MHDLHLRKGKEESLLRFHPWIFSGAIESPDSTIADGELVRVLTHDGTPIAIGHFQYGSIAVRVLQFLEIRRSGDQEITKQREHEFFEARLRSALAVRIALGITDNPANTTYRLVHGEGDSLPGLIIDCFGDVAVIQAHSVGMHHARHTICDALLRALGDRLHHVYYKSETTLAHAADGHNGFLYGGTRNDIALENGLQFHVDWLRGQKTGFFVDQRDNRMLVEQYSRGRRVLNMFCYTGGFSVYAMRGGATSVHSVDSSAKAIELTNDNIALNFPGDPRHAAYCDDAFRFLANNNQQYDLLILDPPAFAKHRSAIKNALKGYTRLNLRGFQSIKPGGILFTFSCSQVITKDMFRNAVFTAAAQAHRKVRILHQLHQPADHPINIYHPEGEYLKGLVLYVE